MIRLKMDTLHSNLVLANADLGGLAFAYQEKMTNDTEGLISQDIFNVVNKIEDQFDEGGYAELKDSEMVTLLLAIRSAFETLIQNNPRVLRRVLVNGDSRFSETPIVGDLSRAARNAHVVLDYLEVNAPKKVMNMWLDERRSSANSMLEDLTKAFE